MNNGSECSTSGNPLAQFTKHSAEDRSLQHERVGGPQGQHPMSMRTQGPGMSAEDQQMMERFNQQQQAGGVPPQAYQFEQMHRELNNMQQMGPGGGPGGPAQANWAQDFKSANSSGVSMNPHTAGQQENRAWANEFGTPPQVHSPAPQMNSMNTMNSGFMPRFGGGGGGGMFMQQQRPMMQQPQPTQAKVQELDSKQWEDQFRQIEEQDKQEESKGKEKVEQDDGHYQKTSEIVVDEDGEEFQVEYEEGDFENVWEKIKSQVLDGEDWTSKDAWDRDFDEFTTNRPDFGDYLFEESNPYMAEQDPYSMGVELMEQGAKLSNAALCFEAAVQKDANHVDAWARLGAAQAQNEKEGPAIRALERCIQLDPGNLNALMNLSVSYTNEACENAAYATLEKWCSMKYPDTTSQARTQEPKLGNEDRFQLHSRVTELFIRAAQLSPDGASIDADVQVGLGVLFYGNEEFEKAIDCFNAALTVRPEDALIWNRLGATLANSSRSEEAIDAYYKALELRPAFVRARYNLGVSCINIGCYHEAAQHLLAALSLHKTDDKPAGVNGDDEDVLHNQSTNLYETLRRVFLAMERRDLVEKVGNGMNVDDFRGEFDF